MEDLRKAKEKVKYPWWFWIFIAVISIHFIFTFSQVIKEAIHGRVVIHTDSQCQIVGQRAKVLEKRVIHHLPKGTYQIKSKELPGQTWTLTTTGHSFDVLMPEGTCADVMDPRINPKNACLNCAQTFWSESAP